jgi:hypothetical protein
MVDGRNSFSRVMTPVRMFAHRASTLPAGYVASHPGTDAQAAMMRAAGRLCRV